MNKTTFILSLTDSMSHLGAPRGQRGDEVLALVVIHPEQRLPVLPHHPEVDLGLHPTSTMWNDFQCPSPEGENI